jgi:NTP pyrophosphatase (non-canonical NTP hydrolase)
MLLRDNLKLAKTMEELKRLCKELALRSPKSIAEYCDEAHSMAVEKGWYKEKRKVPELLCLVHSEISEALEHYRDGNMCTFVGLDKKPDGFGIELADAVIRIFDLCGYFKIDLQRAIDIKMKYNKTRGYRHGNKRA